jgi:hypothetical protein
MREVAEVDKYYIGTFSTIIRQNQVLHIVRNGVERRSFPIKIDSRARAPAVETEERREPWRL